jgi:hypothetical protein
MRSLTKWRHAPSITPVAIGHPYTQVRGQCMHHPTGHSTRRGRLVAFDVKEIEEVAEHIAELVASSRLKVGPIDARDLAEELGVARDWVYANAERLGGVRLGNGPRARLRFDIEKAREALAAGRQNDQPTSAEPPRRRRGRPRREVVPAGVPLIQGRSNR